jgi:nucleoside 2-deoxyribosyltransferase
VAAQVPAEPWLAPRREVYSAGGDGMSEEPYRYYLAHPFVIRDVVRKMEKELEWVLEDKVTLFNPFYDEPRDEIEKFDSGEWGKEKRFKLDPAKIVLRDLHHIKKSEGLVAIVDEVSMCGTFMEIAYAFMMNKVIIVCDLRDNPENHVWLSYHADKIVRNWDDLEEFLLAIH